MAFATDGTAEQADPPQEIVVTGHGLAESPGDRAYAVSVIDKAQIERSASGRLEDVLRDVAGEQGFRRSDGRSANATSQSITLRGLGGNASSRAQLVLDGVPQADPFGGWISFPAFSVDRLASIRVTRGGGSGLWGPGALAGTVELESAGPGEVEPVTGQLLYGSRASVDGHASAMIGRSRAYATLSGAFARGDGFVPIVDRYRGPADRAAPYRQFSLSARGVVAIGATSELQGSLSGFDDRRDRGQDFTRNTGKGVDGSLRLVGRGKTPWSILAYRQQRTFTSQSASIDADRSVATLVNDQFDVPSTGWGGRAELVPLRGAVDLRLGADFRRVEGRTNERYQFVGGAPTRTRTAGGKSLTAGLFGDLTVEAGDLTANVAARLDRWTISDGFFVQRTLDGAILNRLDPPDREGWQPTGRAGLAFRVSPALSLRAAAYRGWRLPTLNELYRPFRVGPDATGANAALSPETSVGAEVGADLALPQGRKVGVTLFSGRLNDAIANVTIAQGPGNFADVGFVSATGVYRRRENLDHVRSRGIEVDAQGRLGPFDARLSYAFVNARIEADGLGAVLDGRRPAQVPRHFLSATAGWIGRAGTAASITARGVSSQFEDDLNERRLRAAVTLDGTLSIPIGRALAVVAKAENIFDRTVEAARSSSGVIERATPRTLWIGLRLR